MKNIFILVLGIFLSTPLAHAYQGNVPDPKNGQGDVETKLFVKSQVAGFQDSIVPGNMLSYGVQTGENDGYTMTRIVGQTLAGQKEVSCISLDTVASGDTSYHLCQTKGFVGYQSPVFGTEFASWSNTTAGSQIVVGVNACVSALGQIRGCSSTTGEATLNLGIIPLSITNLQPDVNGGLNQGGAGLAVILNLQ